MNDDNDWSSHKGGALFFYIPAQGVGMTWTLNNEMPACRCVPLYEIYFFLCSIFLIDMA